MELVEFRRDLLQDAKASAMSDGEGTSAAYLGKVAAMLVDAEVLPSFDRAFYMGTGYRGRRVRVDGFSRDEFDNTLNLIVANFSGEEAPPVLTRTEAGQIFELPLRFVEEVLHRNLKSRIEISTPAYDLADTLLQFSTATSKYRVLLITDRVMSDRIENLPMSEIGGVPVECQIWDPERLWRVFLADSGREEIAIDFAEYAPLGLPCLESAYSEDGKFRSFLCVIPGTVVADIYDQYGARLLEGNVRSFLSTKGAVNKKIRETILTEPKMFFVFNNGIAATAASVELAESQGMTFVSKVSDFQIINGGQTTASLSSARYKDKAALSDVSVQMKLTEIHADPDEALDLVQKISRSSNSQNKVSDADFFSTHPFHVRMEQISRRVFAPATRGAQHDSHWFYERARGQYVQAQMRMSQSERKKFELQNPKNQLVTKTDLAKVRNSWRRLPHIVSKGAQTNFMEFAQWVDGQWTRSDAQFNEQYFEDSISLYILFKHIETLVSHEPWYQQGYRANIVTYTIAWLADRIAAEFPDYDLDLRLIWNRQQVPEVLSEQIRVLAKKVLEAITSPDRAVENVTQWCKQEACWKRVREVPVQLNPRFATILVEKGEIRTVQRGAQKDQKFVSGVQAQAEVLEKGAAYWNAVRQYVQRKKLAVNELEFKSLAIACQIPSKLPNSVQSTSILALLDRVRAEGWNG